MRIEEWMAQYPHPKPYSGLALPQLGLVGVISGTCDPGGPLQSPQTTRDMPKTTDCSFVHPSFKYVVSMRNKWPSIPTHNPALLLPYLSWVKGSISRSCNPGGPDQNPKQPEIRPK